MTKLYSLLVGSHFRPPAKLVLSSLPSATPLELRPEPENPYDDEAVAVFLAASDIPPSAYDSLREELPNFGSSLDELLSQEEEALHLGYLAREGNRDLTKRSDASPTGELTTASELLPLLQHKHEASLLWGPNGESLIKITLGDLA
jgi:hypothetical protein